MIKRLVSTLFIILVRSLALNFYLCFCLLLFFDVFSFLECLHESFCRNSVGMSRVISCSKCMDYASYVK